MLGDLRAALGKSTAAVLQAPPGAGKTTRVPLALLDEPWLLGKKIIMLEPRRLAARAAARWMARSLGDRLGGTVGYRVRHDTRIGQSTRLEVVTEGILTRLLQSDPTLDGIGLVIFDEFHERSLQADLGLALTLYAQKLVRGDLRVLVMSATLDTEPLVRLLGNALVIQTAGRQFPVETRYVPVSGSASRDVREVERRVVSTVHRALREHDGDILVFLPGAAEIRRLAEQLSSEPLGSHVVVAPLHGNLTTDAQDHAVLPSAPGHRKIVLATSIAESSLTIEGVRIVIDSGLARLPRFSARTGMTRLETVRVSRAAAEQRRGRAGRVAAGVCYRLWSEIEQAQLVPCAKPEILEADLAPLALELATAGVRDPMELSWIDRPPASALSQARELLRELEALDGRGQVTEHGRAMAALAIHPRLAHMLLRASSLGLAQTACAVAALLSERDILRGDASSHDADLRTRVEAFASRGNRLDVDAAALARVKREADRLGREIEQFAAASDAGRASWGARSGTEEARLQLDAAGLLVAFGYPDRIAQRRAGTRGRYILRNGRGAALDAHDPLGSSEFIAVAAVDDRQPDSRVFLAAPLSRAELDEHFGDHFVVEREVTWDDNADAVVARRFTKLGAITLAADTVAAAEPTEVSTALLRAIAKAGIGALPWSEGARRLRERLAFLHHFDPTWPDVSDAALAASMEEWLAARLTGMRRRSDVAALDLGTALLEQLDWRQRAALDELAPTHLLVPSGSRIPVDYRESSAPVLAVRLQEMFGLADTPRILGGRVPLTLHLLSPAQRPVQVTRDLAGFWRTSYFDVQRELRGRYPKHEWPDDPLSATATSRAKRQST